MSDQGKAEGAINALTNLAKAVPVYEDALQPVAKQAGKALGTVGEVVNTALMPVRGFVWGANKIENWIQDRVAGKLEGKDKSDIVTPELSIAGPTIEALKFRGYDAEISEMFANLLANNMMVNTKSKVHPTFVEAIKELTSIEAKLFASCVDAEVIPVAGYSIKKDGVSGETFIVYPFNADIISKAALGRSLDVSEWKLSIENLQRLGLLKMDHGRWYSSDAMKEWYSNAEKHPIAEKYRASLDHGDELVVKKGILEVTQLGQNFAAVALKAP